MIGLVALVLALLCATLVTMVVMRPGPRGHISPGEYVRESPKAPSGSAPGAAPKAKRQ